MNREEYLQKMQAFRETLQSECKSNREILDRLAKEHKERARAEADLYDKQVREQRDAHTAKQPALRRHARNGQRTTTLF